jgi:hypothetical protein
MTGARCGGVPGQTLAFSGAGRLRDAVRGSDLLQVLDLVELGVGEVRVPGGQGRSKGIVGFP